MSETIDVQAVAIRPPSQVAIADGDPLELLRFAVQAKADPATITKMMDVRRELNAEKAKAAFDAALTKFQSECPPIPKSKAVKIGNSTPYSFAPLDRIVAAVAPYLKANGFSFSREAVVEPGWVTARITLKHCAGHSETKEMKVPATSKSPMMNEPQMYAAALTFCTRYAFCGALGIVTCDEDLDGRTTAEKPKGPSSLAPDRANLKPLTDALWAVLVKVRGTEKPANWRAANEWLHQAELLTAEEEAPRLSEARLHEVIAKSKITLGAA